MVKSSTPSALISTSIGVAATIDGFSVKNLEDRTCSIAAWLEATASWRPCMAPTIFRFVLLTRKAETTSSVIITRMIIATKRVRPRWLRMVIPLRCRRQLRFAHAGAVGHGDLRRVDVALVLVVERAHGSGEAHR